jgi:ankyrin repeat protein
VTIANNKTPLMLATQQGSVELVKAVLHAHHDTHVHDTLDWLSSTHMADQHGVCKFRVGESALHIAVRRNNAPMVAVLLAAGANPLIGTVWSANQTPFHTPGRAAQDVRPGDSVLHTAVRRSFVDIACMLLASRQVRHNCGFVDAWSVDGTCIQLCCTLPDKQAAAIAAALMDAKADCNAVMADTQSVIFQAVANNMCLLVETLLRQTDVNQVVKVKRPFTRYVTLLHWAVIHCRLDMVNLLLAHHADPNHDDVWFVCAEWRHR